MNRFFPKIFTDLRTERLTNLYYAAKFCGIVSNLLNDQPALIKLTRSYGYEGLVQKIQLHLDETAFSKAFQNGKIFEYNHLDGLNKILTGDRNSEVYNDVAQNDIRRNK